MEEITIALAGNPNVGKSTLFNALTGLRQHTGNWPGKTVERAEGQYDYGGRRYRLVDLPGTYSLLADSPEEEIARDFLCHGDAAVVIAVVDATALSRSLALALQIRMRTERMVVCVNLMDEAAKKGITIDTAKLEQLLGAVVVGTSAARGQGVEALCQKVEEVYCAPKPWTDWRLRLDTPLERALNRLTPCMSRTEGLELLLGERTAADERQRQALGRAQVILDEAGLVGEALRRSVTVSVMTQAEEVGRACSHEEKDSRRRDRQIDRYLTGGVTGPAVMLLGLGVLFYLTLRGASPLTALLSKWLPLLENPLWHGLELLRAPLWMRQILVEGAYRTAAWVAAVMLPPMAIFFPLFTLLEDVGYLPRVAFCLDRIFRSAGAHGRQSLTMCMALGCNVCGVTGCRIIDSPRERLIAIVTNSFVPCNGRMPTLLALSSLFFAGGSYLGATAMFVGLLLLSVVMTWLSAKLLSGTVLRGQPTSFSLELPPYRAPQVGRVLVRSLLDRTLFVLGRAMSVAAPAGALLWVVSHVQWHGETLLHRAAELLESTGQLMGLDGMILLAFLLAFPAGELLLPVLLMGYMAVGTLVEYESLAQLRQILVSCGWSGVTALCTMVLCLFHFPCGTTCLTIRRETGSWRWTALAMILPAAIGVALCVLIRWGSTLLG